MAPRGDQALVEMQSNVYAVTVPRCGALSPGVRCEERYR